MLVLLPILVTYIWRLCAKSSWGIIHIDASARIYIYNYTPYLLFWPALLLGLACSWSVVLSPVIVLFLFLANDDFDLSSTTSSTAGPSSSSPVVLMMRHPSSLDATLTLQPITSSKSWAAMSAEVSWTPWSRGRTSARSCIRSSCWLLMLSIINIISDSEPWQQGRSVRLLLRSIQYVRSQLFVFAFVTASVIAGSFRWGATLRERERGTQRDFAAGSLANR